MTTEVEYPIRVLVDPERFGFRPSPQDIAGIIQSNVGDQGIRIEVVPPHHSVDADVDPVGRAHPETARAMGRKMAPRMGTMRRQVYDWIRSRGGYGATADEVGAHFGWGHQSASAAVSTLKSDGWIGGSLDLAEGGKPRTRPTRSGNPAEVMVVIRGLGE